MNICLEMARLLFDIFYDEECVSEDAFFEWLKHPDQSETEGKFAMIRIFLDDDLFSRTFGGGNVDERLFYLVTTGGNRSGRRRRRRRKLNCKVSSTRGHMRASNKL